MDLWLLSDDNLTSSASDGAVKTKQIPQRSEISQEVQHNFQWYFENSTLFTPISDTAPFSTRSFLSCEGTRANMWQRWGGHMQNCYKISMMTNKAQNADFIWRLFQCSPEGSFFLLIYEYFFGLSSPGFIFQSTGNQDKPRAVFSSTLEYMQCKYTAISCWS